MSKNEESPHKVLDGTISQVIAPIYETVNIAPQSALTFANEDDNNVDDNDGDGLSMNEEYLRKFLGSTLSLVFDQSPPKH